MGKSAKTEKTDRKHLTGREVAKLIEAAAGSRNAERDRCLLLLAYRHGFRVSELCGLPLDCVDIEGRVLHVKRLKRGLSTALLQTAGTSRSSINSEEFIDEPDFGCNTGMKQDALPFSDHAHDLDALECGVCGLG